ncbi:hypothetical protein [Acidovorax sp. 16-64-162]|uniref:hypothetical protein n=1 Tax=Acidovorax sp. 16-64-162 TaxID=1970307 RepID=UPI0025C1BBF7|nr:hypothetical protein [Acidovorax sp. 16-64-162]
MQLSQIPTLVPLPWANSGTKNTIPTASQIAVTPGAASLTDGFPPLTFTPLNAGGIPPFGADWNGILNLLSANTRWDNAGGFYPYDATFSTDIGGYPKGAILSRVDATGFWLSTADNNTANPETDTTGAWVPVNNEGITSVALTNANVTLSATQYAKNIITLTGALTANVQVIFPTIAGLRWKVVNNTTGSFTITCKTSAGTGFTIAQTGIQESFCDGTNLIPSASVTCSLAVNGVVQSSDETGISQFHQAVYSVSSGAGVTITFNVSTTTSPGINATYGLSYLFIPSI